MGNFYENGLVITVGNSKGGVGKTSIVRHLAYTLSEKNYKVLCIDMDTQASLSDSLFLTRNNFHSEVPVYRKTFMQGIDEGNITNLVENVKENFDFIPSNLDLENFPLFLTRKFGLADKKDMNLYKTIKLHQYKYFENLINPLRKIYDFIFIDTPPTSSDFTHAPAYCSDFVVIAFQTQADSLKGVLSYFNNTLKHLCVDFDSSLDLLGILPNELNPSGSIDKQVMDEVTEVFGKNNIFKHYIKYAKSIQNVPRDGISMEGRWNKKMQKEIFEPIADEFIERINKKLGLND